MRSLWIEPDRNQIVFSPFPIHSFQKRRGSNATCACAIALAPACALDHSFIRLLFNPRLCPGTSRSCCYRLSVTRPSAALCYSHRGPTGSLSHPRDAVLGTPFVSSATRLPKSMDSPYGSKSVDCELLLLRLRQVAKRREKRVLW